jgi:hypothetical protein
MAIVIYFGQKSLPITCYSLLSEMCSNYTYNLHGTVLSAHFSTLQAGVYVVGISDF